jgi:hypothetical protein
MNDLRSIVYVSTAVAPFADEELEALLIEARDFNRKHSVTGVLLYNDGSFMQCFEGPEAEVAQAYARIQASERHKDIYELMNEPVPERSFRSWDMGLARPTKSELLRLSTARWKKSAGDARVSLPPSSGLELLRFLWQDWHATGSKQS